MPAKKQKDQNLDGHVFAGIVHGQTKKDAEERFREQRPENTHHRHLVLVKKETIHSPVYPTNIYNVYGSTHTQTGKFITWR